MDEYFHSPRVCLSILHRYRAVSYIGLILIAFGTGGIKPCVVSFGADQFTLPQQREEMSTFFGIFYASINFGSMISTILTPIFRKQKCMGEDECYALAFGVPAALMLVAVSELVARIMYPREYRIMTSVHNTTIILNMTKNNPTVLFSLLRYGTARL